MIVVQCWSVQVGAQCVQCWHDGISAGRFCYFESVHVNGVNCYQENIKVCITGSYLLWGESTSDHWIPSQRASNEDLLSWCCHAMHYHYNDLSDPFKPFQCDMRPISLMFSVNLQALMTTCLYNIDLGWSDMMLKCAQPDLRPMFLDVASRSINTPYLFVCSSACFSVCLSHFSRQYLLEFLVKFSWIDRKNSSCGMQQYHVRFQSQIGKKKISERGQI